MNVYIHVRSYKSHFRRKPTYIYIVLLYIKSVYKTDISAEYLHRVANCSYSIHKEIDVYILFIDQFKRKANYEFAFLGIVDWNSDLSLYGRCSISIVCVYNNNNSYISLLFIVNPVYVNTSHEKSF